ncbi:ribosomal RNA small subunit methyltransferase h [Plakobranchus ocellatus]|uniref:Ribosomal RNA small subunit methyltransferase h n=1 Tax=Plakobranchus ocellatus TaxID=259542 RepID=A0AAV4BKB5_9GAST|nr:ribosomal RNA small subunit methyltransferase h [Plakobranchus ocellatus]
MSEESACQDGNRAMLTTTTVLDLRLIISILLRATVRVPIPDVDKGLGDSRNLLEIAVLLNMTEGGFYRLELPKEY